MSSFWASTKKLSHTTEFFLRRGHTLAEYEIGNTYISYCKSNDHGGQFSGINGYVIGIGFCYNSGFQQIADQITDCPDDLAQILASVNGDYALFVETDSYYAVVTDPWKTKHVWIAVNDRDVFVSNSPDVIRLCASYAYPIDPNTILVVDKKDFTIKKYVNKTWNLTQSVNNHNMVFDALERSVARRYDEGSISTLSSGYDSGVIACALHVLGNKKFSISFVSSEDKDILKQRLDMHGGKILPEIGRMSDQEKNDINSLYIQNHTTSATGESIARVCKHMKKIGKTNILAGNGGDELYADYGYLGKQLGAKSLFGGHFPENLELVWPWHDYLNRQSTLISRLDLVAGYYGIQHKEPLLDVELVQAWINTTSDLKNKRYKNWMYEYMSDHNYPVLTNVKIGFSNNPKNLIE
jgi:asparagine synthetase B (glutamine-hydrolysing)